MPDEDNDFSEFEDWQTTVEFRLGRLRLIGMVDGVIAVGAIAIGAVTFKAMTNLANGMSQLARLTNGIASLVYGGPGPAPKVPDPAPRRADGRIDESIVPTDGPVAEPAMGPQTEASERVKQAIEADPLIPSSLIKDDGLTVDPKLDLP